MGAISGLVLARRIPDPGMKKAPEGAFAWVWLTGPCGPSDQNECFTPTAMARPPLFSVTFSVLKAA